MRILGFLFFLLFLAGFALVLLQGQQRAAEDDAVTAASLAGSRWRVRSIFDEPIADSATLTVEFDDGGRLFGDGGCNLYSGSIENAAPTFSVSGLRSTRKACAAQVMQREEALFAALAGSRSARGDDGRLLLLDDSGNAVLVLEALPPAR